MHTQWARERRDCVFAVVNIKPQQESVTMESSRNAGRLLLYCLVFFSIFIVPLSSIAAESTILEYMPAILSTMSGRSPTPPPPLPPPSGGHETINAWNGTATCLQCHMTEAKEVFSSVHYQWLGQTPYMTNGPETQGKLDVGVNSYCINTTGNWNGCGNCHVGLGARPETTESYAQLLNIDCLVCHQEEYKRKKVEGVFVPDVENMTITMVQAAKTVHKPSRSTCLPCHAKGGGGDNFKRGDMALAHTTTNDRDFDVHMATTGGDLSCQKCHETQQHRMAGKGSDLRPTDLDIIMSCTDCHDLKDTPNGHDNNQTIGNHVARVACQSCHIGTYARNAADTAATEETEIHRDWLDPHLTASGAIHPTPTMAGDLVPKYKWWNGQSSSYLLFDKVTTDPITGKIPTSRPIGAVGSEGSKLYPFKYKTALQPLAIATNDLIALDTSVYFPTGDPVAATISGLENMGYSSTASYDWVETDTYQLITHEVTPSSEALDCNACHQNTQRMDLQGELGYDLKAADTVVCTQCHGMENSEKSYTWMHNKHVEDKEYDCSWCHTFSRPERGLK